MWAETATQLHDLRRQLLYAAGGALHRGGVFRALHKAVFPETLSVAMYHGVVETPLPVRDFCFTSCASFAAHMAYLHEHFSVLHLEEALSLAAPHTGKPLACITFDEGFAGVHDHAFPILRQLRMPATVYLVTDFVDSDRTVWAARLHQAILETSASFVDVGEVRYSLADARARALASAALQEHLKCHEPAALEAALLDVEVQLGVSPSASRPPRRGFGILSASQIRRMAQDDLFRFGAHTATHQILTRTTAERAAGEITRSVRAVAALVRRPSATFAYPNGGLGDFDEAAIAALRALGIRYGVTTLEGPNFRGDDPYRVRRYGIGAEDPVARFAGLMHHSRAATAHLLGQAPFTTSKQIPV